jgi:hypothetical protein
MAACATHQPWVLFASLMSLVGTKLPILDVRYAVANGGKPDMARDAHFGCD